MTKICTTIPQSKRLMELGLDFDTADMWWQTSEEDGVYEKECPRILVGKIPQYMAEYLIPIPAWSLSALLEFLKHYGYSLSTSASEKIMITISNKTLGNISLCFFDNPLDAAFEMVVWLLENEKV